MHCDEQLAEWGTWLESLGRAPGTISLRLSHVRRYFRETRNELTEVTTSDLVQWLGAHEWGPAARASARASMRAFFAWAVIAGHVERDPAAAIPPVLQPRALPRPATNEDILEAMSTARDPRAALALDIMATCGLRRGEVAAIHRRDVEDRAAGPVLRVVGKGGHVRVVPVPPRIAARISEAPGWLFPGAVGGHISAGWLGKLMSRALPNGVTPHQLRHSYGTRAYMSTGDLLAVQRLLGHSTPSTTQIYVQVSSLALVHAARAGWDIVPRGLNVTSSEPRGPLRGPSLEPCTS